MQHTPLKVTPSSSAGSLDVFFVPVSLDVFFVPVSLDVFFVPVSLDVFFGPVSLDVFFARCSRPSQKGLDRGSPSQKGQGRLHAVHAQARRAKIECTPFVPKPEGP